MLGFMDTFSSIASPASDAFVMFDNVRVEELSDRIRFLSASATTNGQIRLLLSGVPGSEYAIETSTNLLEWKSIGILSCSNGPMPFIDTPGANFQRRFYRAIQAVP